MALAETASIFCETIVLEAALRGAGSPTTPSGSTILDASLQGACQVVVDIHSRFLFEQRRVRARAATRELSVDELNELMLDAQRETYGDGLDPDALHPYMWAVKPHYYTRAVLQLAVHVRPAVRPRPLRALPRGPGRVPRRLRRPAVVHRPGRRGALAARFGIDVRRRDFWRASLDVIRGEIDRYCASALTGSAGESAHLLR